MSRTYTLTEIQLRAMIISATKAALDEFIRGLNVYNPDKRILTEYEKEVKSNKQELIIDDDFDYSVLELKNKTIPELKAYIKFWADQKGESVPTTGNKATLLERANALNKLALRSSQKDKKCFPQQDIKQNGPNKDMPKLQNSISAPTKNNTAQFDLKTITITFGDQAENHHGMMKLGTLADVGFSISDLKVAQGKFQNKGYVCELIDLNKALNSTSINTDCHAVVLIVRKGADALFQGSQLTSDDMFQEQLNLKWDIRAKMYGNVVNKKARWNLCYGDIKQEPDYENGKGRIIPFQSIPCTNMIRSQLEDYVGPKAQSLMGEGNYYHNIHKCGIGFHGDFERKKVIAIRLGASMPLHFQWFLQSKPIGQRIPLMLNHGDLYIMSEKATGQDWKLRKNPTLRHAAGCQKFLNIVEKGPLDQRVSGSSEENPDVPKNIEKSKSTRSVEEKPRKKYTRSVEEKRKKKSTRSVEEKPKNKSAKSVKEKSKNKSVEELKKKDKQ